MPRWFAASSDRIEPLALDRRNDRIAPPRGARADDLLAVVVELRSVEVDVGIDQHRSPSHCSTRIVRFPQRPFELRLRLAVKASMPRPSSQYGVAGHGPEASW